MKIDNLKTHTTSSRTRVSATVQWEDCGRPRREIYFESDARFADDLSCNPNAFLAGAIVPAMHHGERRIIVDGTLCPQLRNGLTTAMQILRSWYGASGHQPVQIEATQGFEAPTPAPEFRTASFMSGGVDALATLRNNRLDFDLDHPGSIRDCFIVHGFQLGAYEREDDKMNNFEMVVSSLSELADSTQMTLIPVFTNLRHLNDDLDFFALEFHGAFLSAVAHAFSRRISAALIASTSSIADQQPFGTHPLLDSNYSSANVSLRHDCVWFTRQDKVRLIAEWDAGLRVVRSCSHPFPPDGAFNCGQCEKCLRTMTELLLVSKLGQCPTFPSDDVTPEMIGTLRFKEKRNPADPRQQFPFVPHVFLNYANVHQWREMVEPLKGIRRHDLAQAVETKLAEYDRFRRLATFAGRVSRLDQRCLGGMLRKTYRKFKSTHSAR